MDLSKLAVFLAFLYLAVGLPALFAPDGFRKAALKFRKKTTNLQISAIISLLFGYLILREYHLIQKNWETVLSVIGYLALIKGLVSLWWPGFTKSQIKKFVKMKYGVLITGILSVALGLFIGYLGFYVY